LIAATLRLVPPKSTPIANRFMVRSLGKKLRSSEIPIYEREAETGIVMRDT
jgi:hypothetical protein